jgi:GNAT superfamily N-acetyltransferase
MTTRRVDGATHARILRQLQRAALPYDEPMSTDEGSWWVTFVGETPVAFAGSKRSTRWNDAVYLCRAGVIPAFRGAGIQKTLIRVREAAARKAGMTWLITDTHENPASANSLISCGFRLYEPNSPWANKGALYWRKRISKERPA